MSAEQSQRDVALFSRRLGDDALILGQRLCEWCSHAPMLEEELAIANVALDYLGRARMFYGYAGELLNCTEDDLAFLRDAGEMENMLMVELPRGDFAFSMVRQYLLDEFDVAYFDALQASADQRVAAIAVKTLKEARYHQRRSAQWMLRLGLGTAESKARAQAALDELWGYVEEFFSMDALETRLAEAGIAVLRQRLRDGWLVQVTEQITQAGLAVPTSDWQVGGGRRGVHTEHLGHMLSQMQFMQRAYPGLAW